MGGHLSNFSVPILAKNVEGMPLMSDTPSFVCRFLYIHF